MSKWQITLPSGSTKTEKRIGPRIDPWGTPRVKGEAHTSQISSQVQEQTFSYQSGFIDIISMCKEIRKKHTHRDKFNLIILQGSLNERHLPHASHQPNNFWLMSHWNEDIPKMQTPAGEILHSDQHKWRKHLNKLWNKLLLNDFQQHMKSQGNQKSVPG